MTRRDLRGRSIGTRKVTGLQLRLLHTITASRMKSSDLLTAPDMLLDRNRSVTATTAMLSTITAMALILALDPHTDHLGAVIQSTS